MEPTVGGRWRQFGGEGWRQWCQAEVAEGGGPARRTEVVETGQEAGETGEEATETGEEADGAPEVAADGQRRHGANTYGSGALTLAPPLRPFVWHANGENGVRER